MVNPEGRNDTEYLIVCETVLGDKLCCFWKMGFLTLEKIIYREQTYTQWIKRIQVILDLFRKV